MIIDGNKIAEQELEQIRQQLQKNSGRPPCLAIVMVGNNPSSSIYVKRKKAACERVGISAQLHHYTQEIEEKELLDKIEQFNQDHTIDGILVQLPLPSHLDPIKVNLNISPQKDVDGFHPINMGKLLLGDLTGFAPCTPLGVMTLLERSQVELKGKHVVIVGRSNIVGKPLAALLMQNRPGANATVTVAHSQTQDIDQLCQTADVIVAAIGKPKWLQADWIKEGAVVIDVGINKIQDSSQAKGYKIVGDVDFDNILKKCGAITPVPGGVGPMTIASLLKNVVLSYQFHHV